MALTQNEKDLLAVVRYYNGEKVKVIRLVVKLATQFDFESAAAMTGFTLAEVDQIVTNYDRKRAKTVKSMGKRIGSQRVAEKVMNEKQPDLFKEPEPQIKIGLPIELNADSPLSERVAYDMAQAISQELKGGDYFWTQKEAAQKFQVNVNTVSAATKILFEKKWIEREEPNNSRSRYVVK
jgi:hypothetical protein